MDAPQPRIRRATEADLDAINRIYNDEILHGVATWDLEPWTADQRRAWFAEHDDETPVLVAELDGDGAACVVGFCYLSRYRKAGYRFTREHTVFVDPAHHRRGIGRALMAAVLDEARRLGVHAIVAWIEEGNEASIALHREFGFEVVGGERETGYKFGRWLSTVEMELLIEGSPPSTS